jgi:hypothetical protein
MLIKKIFITNLANKQVLLPWFFLLASLSLAACNAQPSEQKSLFPVDELFVEFYEFLGGQPRLGAALSPLLSEGQIQKQYFESSLLQFDSSKQLSERYSLAPLGYQIGEQDTPIPNPGNPDLHFVDGYIIYDVFHQAYEEMGGARYVGRPLTGVRYLAAENRVEQYFENVGFSLDLSDENATLQLIPYGRLACASDCGTQPPAQAIIQSELAYGEPFVSTVASLGEELVGQRLAGPYLSADGSIEVIYEHFVLVRPTQDSPRALPKAILPLLGIAPEPLAPPAKGDDFLFYNIGQSMGYNIPLDFANYIAQNGGFDLFGAPISESKVADSGNPSQCFENACLGYNTGGFERVEVLDMGAEYKRRFYDQQTVQNGFENLEIQMQVWEDHSQISSAHEQTVHVSLFAGSQFLEGFQPYLVLSLPGAGEQRYFFSPTDSNGHSQLQVPPVSAQNGTLVLYEVCLEAPEMETLCSRESYLIWGNP